MLLDWLLSYYLWGIVNYFLCLFSGASTVSGFFAAACSLPFDYVKTQIQKMQPDASGKYPYTGSLDCAMKTLKSGGPFKFYTGFPVYCVRIAPHVMVLSLSFPFVMYLVFFNESQGGYPYTLLFLYGFVCLVISPRVFCYTPYFTLAIESHELQLHLDSIHTTHGIEVFQILFLVRLFWFLIRICTGIWQMTWIFLNQIQKVQKSYGL